MSTPKPTLDTTDFVTVARTPDAASVIPRAASAQPWYARLVRASTEEIRNLNFPYLLANALVSILPSLSFSRVRTSIYRLAGMQIGAHSLIFGRIRLTGAPPRLHRLTIGSGTMVNDLCFVDLNAEIHIGDRVSIGHHVTLITADHELGPAACRAGALVSRPIVIEDGCWIGARCTLLPGVHIGKSSVVAAGSLVYGDVPANRLVGGVPARALRTLPGEP